MLAPSEASFHTSNYVFGAKLSFNFKLKGQGQGNKKVHILVNLPLTPPSIKQSNVSVIFVMAAFHQIDL